MEANVCERDDKSTEIKEVFKDVDKMNPEQKKRILYALKGAVMVTEDDSDDTE